MIAVILAGGSGKRLWPMSRQAKPKQFYEIISDRPMITDVFERLLKSFDRQDIYIATLPELKDQILQLLPDCPEEQLILEPAKRDSGPAMAYAAFKLIGMGRGDETVVFIPTDHYIANADRFLKCLEVGDKLIKETGKLLDISVIPNFPSTALGYTQIGDKYDDFDGIQVFNFKGHVEKPDHATALSYIESGNYLWHANYYMWTANKFLRAYKEHAPEIYDKIEQLKGVEDKDRQKEIFESIPAISIDYAVTEKINPDDVLIIRGDFGWSDIGSWDILYDKLKQQSERTNVTKGRVIEIDTHHCLIYSSSDKVTATIGLNNMIVVDTKDALLICPQSRAQEVKAIVKKIEEDGLEDYL